MHRIVSIAILTLALAASTSTARADVIDDLRRGDCLFFDNLTFTARGERRGAREFCVRKAPGSLYATINARDLGLDRDILVALTPSVAGTTVVWTFDQPINPGVEVEPLHWVDHVRGAIAMTFSPAPFSTREWQGEQRQYSARGDLAPGTWLEVHVSHWLGDSWEPGVDFAISALGGVAPARVERLDLSASTVCASPRPRTIAGTVTLVEPSPASGTAVDLGSDDPATIRASGTPMVAATARTAPVRVRVEGATIGTQTVTARVGDSVVSRPLEIVSCALPFVWNPVRRDTWQSCAFCADVRANSSGTLVATLANAGVLITPQGKVHTIRDLTGIDALPRAINDLGQVLAVSRDGKSSFIIGPERDGDGGRDVVVHDGLDAADLGDQGMLVGRDVDGKAVVSGPFGAVVLPVDGETARVVATNAMGWVVGDARGKDGLPRAFLYDNEKLRTLPLGKASRALAVSDAGSVVGTSLDDNGQWRAFAYSSQTGVEDLGPDGYQRSEAFAVDGLGHVLVAARDGDRRETFLVTPQREVVPAGSLSTTSVKVGELLGFSSAGKLLVRGVFEGKGGVFELVPELAQH